MAVSRSFGARTTKAHLQPSSGGLKVTGTASLGAATLENKRLAYRLLRPSASPDVNHPTRRTLSPSRRLPPKTAKSPRWDSRCCARDVALSALRSAAPKRARHKPASIWRNQRLGDESAHVS